MGQTEKLALIGKIRNGSNRKVGIRYVKCDMN